MALAKMKKVIIATYRSEVEELLEDLQYAGIVQIYNAEQAMVSKEWPELQSENKKPRDIEETVDNLKKAIDFLGKYRTGKSETNLFNPRINIDKQQYASVVTGQEALELLNKVNQLDNELEDLLSAKENTLGMIESLKPWKNLSVNLEDLSNLDKAKCVAALVPNQYLEETKEKLTEEGAAVEEIGIDDSMHACLVVCLQENFSQVQKVLRGADCEVANFEGKTGLVADNIAQKDNELADIERQIEAAKQKATELSQYIVKLQILHDHYQNMLNREQTRLKAPATENVVLLEGWVKEKNYKKLDSIIGKYPASCLDDMELGEDETSPIDLENNKATQPFETITRLYGMPSVKDFDPTVFLAPFFALFFGICLTDAAYGLILISLLTWVVFKLKGDKKFIWMLLICSVLTVIAGALTGGWFANAVQSLLPQEEGSIGYLLNQWRVKIMLFDPMEQPLIFIGVALALGFIQVLAGLIIGFSNHLRQKEYASAIFEKLTWIILLNCLLLFALAKYNVLPGWLSGPLGITSIIMIILIFWFTERNSGMAGRIGGGVFAVFSTVFYMGDILSYVRLMALGMVTAGLGMAVNILTQLVMDVPYVGFILGLFMFVAGHAVNLLMSLLSAFVHSLRLQFVEFFPKFFNGGGHEFKPFNKKYEHVAIVQNDNK